MDLTDLHLWLLDEGCATASQIADACSLLSDEEHGQMRRFRFVRDQRLFVAARSYLRQVLSNYAPIHPAEWSFQITRSGRPEIAPGSLDQPLHFSVSHTYGLVAVAVSGNRDIGVDVERVERGGDLRSIAAEAMTPEEQEQLASLPASQYRESFLQLWTLKEAYAKARGLGLSIGLQRFRFEVQGNVALAFAVDEELRADLDSAWQFQTMLPNSTHILSFAVRRQFGSTQLRWAALGRR